MPNRLHFMRRLEGHLRQARQQGGAVAVFFLDLDGFKAINDTHGHRAGDEVLIAASQRIRAAMRSSDDVARLGGDEFVAAIPLPAGGEGVLQRMMRDLQGAIDTPLETGTLTLRVGASIGIALYPEDGSTADELMAAADHAMYARKRAAKAACAAPPAARDRATVWVNA